MVLRLLCKQPMNVLNLFILAGAALATVYAHNLEPSPLLAIRCGLLASMIGMGGMTMADLLGSDRNFLLLVAERGAIVPMWKASSLVFGGLWLALGLPALLCSLTRQSVWAVALQILVFASITIATVNASYLMVQLAERKKLATVGIWSAPVLVFFTFASTLILGVGLLSIGASLIQQELIAAGFTCLLNIPLFALARRYLHRLPRTAPGPAWV